MAGTGQTHLGNLAKVLKDAGEDLHQELARAVRRSLAREPALQRLEKRGRVARAQTFFTS